MLTFSFKNTQISYTETGTGKPIIFLHGFLENKTMWIDFLPVLSKNNQVITVDLLGHGHSDCLGYIHTMETQAEMIFALMNELKIKKASFVGHSMGGYIALAFTEMYPKMITRLVLLNSTSYEDSEDRKANRDRAIKAVKQNYTSFVRLSIGNLFSEKNREILVEDVEKANITLKSWNGLTNDIKNDKIIQILAYAFMYELEVKEQQLEVGIISFKNLKSGFLPFIFKEDKTETTLINTEIMSKYVEELVVLLSEILDNTIDF